MGRELLQHLVIQGSSHVIYLIALDAGEQFYGREGFVEIPEAAIPRFFIPVSHPIFIIHVGG